MSAKVVDLQTERNRREAAQLLIATIEQLEHEARSLGFVIVANTLNRAKNAAGWELAGDAEEAALASSGLRPTEDKKP